MSLIKRLAAAWKVIRGRAPHPDPLLEEEREQIRDDEGTMSLRRQLAAARLDLQEARDALAAERSRRAAVEGGQTAAVREAVESRQEALFTQLAAPLLQLRMQDALLEAGRDVAARDVMAVARSFTDAVAAAGLEPIGMPGEKVRFDPETCQMLSGGEAPARGQEVLVRFPGYRYNRRVLRKALVERQG